MITCFDIGGTAIKSARASSPRDIKALDKVPTPLDDFEAFAAAIGRIATEATGNDHSLVAISLAGIIDSDTGRITCANIPCIDGRPLVADLSAILKRPVLIANDADCFALAEAIAGAGRGHRVVFGAILGSGVGGGVIIDGKILSGAGGFAGEWGHGPISATSAGSPPVAIPRFPCGCGQTGCIDVVGSARGLERLHRHLHGADASSTEIIDAWTDGNAKAARTVDCHVDILSDALSLVVNVLGASIVPVGGGLSNSQPLIERIDLGVRSRILRRTNKPLVVRGECRIEPGLIGAGLLGLAEVQS
ncbi:N-acetylglucosamine kinase [Phyllobacterium phragmitis]|uniref:N-acetylglucosamine kinase n=1 Tax=Phyllobacterium phragmitis TaxID=2670329 RepID=A0A2S9IX72_9HYPH|nr:ROK family protein [Phyllobacterium phragmitis]PRD45108.1 N-acetylglucosamine kinase [Phyllobacterium phragmitis]